MEAIENLKYLGGTPAENIEMTAHRLARFLTHHGICSVYISGKDDIPGKISIIQIVDTREKDTSEAGA